MAWPGWLGLNARGIELAGVCLSLPAAGLSVHQALSARDDAKQAEQARAAAEKNAVAAERLAAAAEKQASMAGAQAQYAERLVAIQGRHLDVARAERDAAVRIASAAELGARNGQRQISEAANNVAVEIGAANEREWQFRRARITVPTLDMDNLVVGKKPVAYLNLQNMASTSALNVNVWSAWHWRSSKGTLPSTPMCENLQSHATITISGSRRYVLTRQEPWTTAEHERLSSASPITVIGSVCYEDERHQKHQTTFCRFATGEGGITTCDVGERER